MSSADLDRIRKWCHRPDGTTPYNAICRLLESYDALREQLSAAESREAVERELKVDANAQLNAMRLEHDALAAQLSEAQARLAERHEPVVTDAMVSAALCSQARDDEGEFPVMLDLLDFSGENKSRTAMRHALECALLYAPETRRTAVKESLTTASPAAPAAQAAQPVSDAYKSGGKAVADDVVRDAKVGAAIERAARELPRHYSIEIEVESGAATVRLYDDEFCRLDHEPDGETLAGEINAAIDAALLAAQQQKGDK